MSVFGTASSSTLITRKVTSPMMWTSGFASLGRLWTMWRPPGRTSAAPRWCLLCAPITPMVCHAVGLWLRRGSHEGGRLSLFLPSHSLFLCHNCHKCKCVCLEFHYKSVHNEVSHKILISSLNFPLVCNTL